MDTKDNMFKNHYLGGVLSPFDKRDYTVATVGLVPTKEALPIEYMVVENPRILDQGMIGSCVPHSIASSMDYALLDTPVDLSRGFIYGNRDIENDYLGEGMIIREALSHLLHEGSMLQSDFSFNRTYPEVSQLIAATPDAYEKASKHKITSYYRLYDVDDIKRALIKRHSIIMMIPVRENFGAFVHASETEINGFHAVALIGWDEGGWICQNSWGIEFGKNGTFHIDYDYDIAEIWGIVVDDIKMNNQNTLEETEPENSTTDNDTKEEGFFTKLLRKIIEFIKSLFS